MREVDLLIVGAGPAGMAAARDAAARGAHPLLMDERPADELGGLAGLPPRVEILTRHSAWGVFPNESDAKTVGVYDGARTFLVRAHELVLATGAVDVDLAFSGCELAGVVGGLEMLRQLQAGRPLDARRMVVLGAGDLGREVARRAAELGVEVVARVGPGDSDSAVPAYPRHTIRRALGAARVEQVVLTSPEPDAADVAIEADSLCVAIGRRPSIELAYLAGCPIDYDVLRGGHVPRSIPGVTVTGDLAGTSDAADPTWHRLADRYAMDQTVICACEGVTRADILDVLPRAYGHPDEVKRLTRAGMGVCQGRRCRTSIASLLAQHLDVPLGEIPLASFRPPVRLLPLAALAAEAQPPVPACYAPFAAAEAHLAESVRAGRLRPLTVVRFRRAALEAAYGYERDGATDLEIQASARALERETRESEARS